MSKQAIRETLQRSFGLSAADVSAFDPLTEAQAAFLVQSFEAAQQHQAEALEQAIEEGFRHLPALLRGPVRRILGA